MIAATQQSRISTEPNSEAIFAGALQQLVMRYSLSWLAAGCATGFIIAFLLFCPAAGKALGEFSYGRWLPVHLNIQLYGWSALPMVGVLLKGFLRPGRTALFHAHAVLGIWSLALLMGGVSWLAGETSGKLFLDWSGLPLLLYMSALGALWAVIGWHYLLDLIAPLPGRRLSLPMLFLKGTLLAGLSVVPLALYHVSQRSNYPAIDPGTGGPTGASLLASTLGIILVLALIPRFLGLVRKPGANALAFWIWFGLAVADYLAIDHGTSSHRDWRQIGAVAMLLGSAPLLIGYLRGFQWNERSGLWLNGALCWWGLLVSMGFIVFLPGVLDRVKFTHALIAHADLAMPGLMTSINMLILANLATPPAGAIRSITGRRAFWLWQGALAIQVVLLLGIAAMEAVDHGALWKTTGYSQLFFNLRLLTGISMGTAAALWVWSVWAGKDYEDASELNTQY